MSIFGYTENYEAVIHLLKDRFKTNPDTGKITGTVHGAEIGVRYGFFSEAICKACEDLRITCVDPYTPYQDLGIFMTAEEQHKIFLAAQERLKPCKVNFLVLPSIEAAELVPDSSLDFVFIDAEHTYEACMFDLIAWCSKVKSGGFISGHDYSMKEVNRAVNAFWKDSRDILHGIAHFDNPADVWAMGVK